MGTNYYLHVNPCRCCKRPERILHIGKSSYGWHFQLRVYPNENINDLSDWKPLFDKWPIFDEYNHPVSGTYMLSLITDRENEARPATKEGCDRWNENSRRLGLPDYVAIGINGLYKGINGQVVGHGEGPWDYVDGEFS